GRAAVERGGEPGVEGCGLRTIDATRGKLRLPAATNRAHLGQQIVRRDRVFLLGRQCFELGTDRFAGRHALAAGDVVALRVAGEELIARAAEALPQRLRPRLLDRADRLPLRLETLDLVGRVFPVR